MESPRPRTDRYVYALTLGALGVENETPTLLALAQGSDALSRQMALMGLSRLGEGRNEGRDTAAHRSALSAMAEAVFSGPEGDSPRAIRAAEAVQRAGVASLVLLAAHKPEAPRDPLPVPEGVLSVEDVLAQLELWQHLIGYRQHVLARLSQPQVSTFAAPQLHAQLRLELLDGVAERRLRQRQRFGRRGERTVPVDLSDDDQVNALEHAR